MRRLVRAGISLCLALASLIGLSVIASAAGGGPPPGWEARPPFHVKILGTRPDGRPQLTRTTPTGLPPCDVARVYDLGLWRTTLCGGGTGDVNTLGAGQTIAIVDAYHDPNAYKDLSTFSSQYGLPVLTQCSTPTQTSACFAQVYSRSKPPRTNSGWALEESLDIEWAHALAPGAKILLVEAYSASLSDLLDAVSLANSLGATVVSMSWGGNEFSGEATYESYFSHAGTFYTASSGDNGTGTEFPAALSNVIAVGGTTLKGCSGTSCAGFTSETAWSGSGGGSSAYESIPAYQKSYSGPVFGAASISALTGGFRGIPDVSFDADPSTGVSVYDSTSYQGQSGWFTLGGTSVGAPSWAGVLATGQAAGKTALQGDSAIYAEGYTSNLRDITAGTNGSCGTGCSAGTGYDLVTGLGSPIHYP